MFNSDVTTSDSYKVRAHMLLRIPISLGFSAKFMIIFIFPINAPNLLLMVLRMLAASPSVCIWTLMGDIQYAKELL